MAKLQMFRSIFGLVIVASMLSVPTTFAQAQAMPKKKSKAAAAPATKATVEESAVTETIPEVGKVNTGFKFNTDGDSAAGASGNQSDRRSVVQPKINFKVPGNAAEEANMESVDPVNILVNETPYKMIVGYPRFDLVLAFNPINVSFTQKLTNPAFEPNFSTTSLSSFSILARLNPSLQNFFEFEHSQYTVSAASATGSIFSVTESNVVVDSQMFRGYYCFLGNTSLRRSCIGGELGQDSNPSLEFTSSTVLKIARIRNFVVGPSAFFQFPLASSLYMSTKVAYLLGLNAGQNSNLAAKSDNKIIAEFGFGGELNQKSSLSLVFNYFQRNSKVEGARGATTETWNTTSSGFGAKIAYAMYF